jgi:hypothetical protein
MSTPQPPVGLLPLDKLPGVKEAREALQKKFAEARAKREQGKAEKK